MRADRLLTLLGLLRAHGRLSAGELARRLEVTPRTVARDIEALSAAGVPVFAERGRAGGYELLPGYRPDVEHLSAAEARALFVAGGPPVADALGLGHHVSSALRKLATGLPDPQVRSVGALDELIVVDPGGWGGAPTRTPEALAHLFEALQAGRRLRVAYRPRGASEANLRTLDPWGLVLAGGTWYLLAAHRGRPHTYRLDRMESVKTLDAAARRPARLDLAREWTELRASWRAQPTHEVTLRVSRPQADLVVRSLGLVLRGEPTRTDDGPDHTAIRAEVTTLRGAVGVLLGFGAWVEVIEPTELRVLMVDIADEARRVYLPD